MKRIYLIFLFLFLSGLSTLTSAYDRSGSIITTTQEFVTPSQSAEMRADLLYNPVWHVNGSTYFVWVDAKLRPMVTKTTNGVSQSVPLDNNPDYTVLSDGHNRFGMGIDKAGFIHITGDMHNYTYQTVEQGKGKNYPIRYQKQDMLYWKSVRPYDVTSGFQFVGGRNASTSMPGTGWSYGRFFTDNNGELYYSARVKAIFASHVSGEMGLGLYRFDTSTNRWTALGANAEDTRPGTYFKVILWENAGMAPGKWYQGFMADFKFDHDNRLHLGATINSNSNFSDSDRVIYAYSNDGGINWNRANGSKISKLPIRAIDNLPNTGEIVDKTTTPPFFTSRVRVVSDQHGGLGLVVGTQWYIWNGKSWDKRTNLFPAVTADLNNQKGIVLTGWSKLLFADDVNAKLHGYDLAGFDDYVGIDANALRKSGLIYGVGFNRTTGLQTVLKTTVTPAPLPQGWEGRDISFEPGIIGGTAGFSKNQFVINNYDDAIDNPHDAFYYVYKKLDGDGMLQARIVSATNSSGNARTGIMMRDTLASNAKHVSVLINPSRQLSSFSFRRNTNDQTINNWNTTVALPYFVRLERVADKFTGYTSKDGLHWVQSGTITIPMSSTIYIGLAAASYNKNGMQTVVFDNVNVPARK